MRPSPDDMIAAVETILVRDVRPRITDAHAEAMLTTAIAVVGWLKKSWADWAPAMRDACLELAAITADLKPHLTPELQQRVAELAALGSPDRLCHTELTGRYEAWRQLTADIAVETMKTADNGLSQVGQPLIDHLVEHSRRVRRNTFSSGTIA